MKYYLITYDLNHAKYHPTTDYSNFYSAIKKFGFDTPFQHFVESAWVIKTECTSKEIFDKLKPNLFKEDLLYIVEINVNNHSGWLGKAFWEWIKTE